MNENQVLLEQYKTYVEMADRISARRSETNKFFISLLTALLAIVSLTVDKNAFNDYERFVFIVVSIMGLALNVLWYVNIRSYRQLNSGKFKVILEMESNLAFPCYEKEWKILGEGKESKKYLQLTRVERFVPFILSVPYFLLLIHSLIKYASNTGS